jgi:hypothetical protein
MQVNKHDVVALLEDKPVKRFDTGEPLLLRRGQIGIIVTTYDDGACEVEFADRDGRAFAMLPLRPNQFMLLHDTPEFAAA